MSNINQLVYECLLFEEEQKITKLELNKHIDNKKVKEFINLSTHYIKKNNLNEEELSRAKELFQDENVQQYLNSVSKVAKRDSYIFGFSTGGVAGGVISLISAGIATSSLAAALAIGALGAVLAGFATSLLIMPILKILRRWKAEDEILQQSPSGIRIHKV